MAERGFVTMSVDLAFWGGSDGQPRNAVAPELYAETFSAAVDYLGTGPFADREKIGAIGICGSGSFAISAAKIDPRLKAVATISMYDMGAANRNGLNHSLRVFTCDFKVEANERDSFEKFLARHEGYKSFFWRPPGINRKIRVVCRTWSATEHITYTDFSCQFDEVVI